MEILINVLTSLQPTEKDLIAFVFFGGMFACCVGFWVYSDLKQWHMATRDKESRDIDREYIAKLFLLPVLALVLVANGASKEERNRRISDFFYA